MDISAISLVVSCLVATISVLNFFNTKSVQKEAGMEKFARSTSVDNDLQAIRKDIKDIDQKLEDHGGELGILKIDSAVLESQMTAMLREVEKLDEKIDEWRDNE